MPHTSKPPPDDAEQSKRFIEAAREIGADESRDAFEQVFLKMSRRDRHPRRERSRASKEDRGGASFAHFCREMRHEGLDRYQDFLRAVLGIGSCPGAW
jgi:hypothetical protein